MPSQHYEKLARSATDDTIVGEAEPFVDEEAWWKEGYEPENRRRATLLAVVDRLKPLRWLFEAGLVAVIVLLLVGRQREGHQLTGDVTGFAPRFPQKIMSFELNRNYVPEKLEDFFTKKTRKNWVDLVPTGLGFLEIKDPGNYDGLPTPLNDYPNRTIYTTSMTHQLHCLHHIVDSYTRLALGREEAHNAWHVQHCFDYIRQGIMCAGDVALEGAETTFPKGEGGSDGWDAQHVCKDYGAVYEYLQRARATDGDWI